MTLEAPRPTAPNRKQRDVAVQLNTRVSLTTRALIDDVAFTEGLSIREVIENAIVERWGDTSRSSAA